jgi:hypothetical protein
MSYDYFHSEIEQTRDMIDVDELLAFQLSHDIQVIRGEDYQYVCYVDGKQSGAIGITPMYAMVTGVRDYMRKLFSPPIAHREISATFALRFHQTHTNGSNSNTWRR